MHDTGYMPPLNRAQFMRNPIEGESVAVEGEDPHGQSLADAYNVKNNVSQEEADAWNNAESSSSYSVPSTRHYRPVTETEKQYRAFKKSVGYGKKKTTNAKTRAEKSYENRHGI